MSYMFSSKSLPCIGTSYSNITIIGRDAYQTFSHSWLQITIVKCIHTYIMHGLGASLCMRFHELYYGSCLTLLIVMDPTIRGAQYYLARYKFAVAGQCPRPDNSTRIIREKSGRAPGVHIYYILPQATRQRNTTDGCAWTLPCQSQQANALHIRVAQ